MTYKTKQGITRYVSSLRTNQNKCCQVKRKVNKVKCDERMSLLVHVTFSNQIYCNFFLQNISSKWHTKLWKNASGGCVIWEVESEELCLP